MTVFPTSPVSGLMGNEGGGLGRKKTEGEGILISAIYAMHGHQHVKARAA